MRHVLISAIEWDDEGMGYETNITHAGGGFFPNRLGLCRYSE